MLDKQYIFYILIFLALIVKNSCKKLPWGSPCKYDYECRDGKLDLFGDNGPRMNPLLDNVDVFSQCLDSRCRCIRTQHLEFRDNNFVCIDMLYGRRYQGCNKDKPDTCVNGTCMENDAYKLTCHCNKGLILWGKRCREKITVGHSENCRTPSSGPVPICDYDNYMSCHWKTKTCECFEPYYLDTETKHCLSVEAYVAKYPEGTIAGYKEFCGTTSAGMPRSCNKKENLKCVSSTCSCPQNNFYDKESNTCIAKDVYIKKYPEEILAGLNEFCGIKQDMPKVCDETANMTCVSEKCKCTGEFYPNYTNSTCESKASYAKKHNISSYKVMPGVYCDSEAECIEGLRCKSNECACPYGCAFDKSKDVCDCGRVSAMEGAPRAVLVGVIGGIVIIVFWGCMIKKIIDKNTIHSKDCDDARSTEPYRPVPLKEPYRIKTTTGTTNNRSTPAPLKEPYRIKTTTGTTNNGSTSASVPKTEPSSATPYPVSPVPDRQPSPIPPYSVPPAPEPSAIPHPPPLPMPPPYNPNPYSTNPNLETSDPAPYSASPVPYTINPNPYSTNPAPTTSDPPPYSTSPAPDTTNPSPYSTSTFNAPAYSIIPSAPPAIDIYKPII